MSILDGIIFAVPVSIGFVQGIGQHVDSENGRPQSYYHNHYGGKKRKFSLMHKMAARKKSS